MKDIDGNDACDEADQTGEQHQPPVMLIRQAAKYTEHVIRPLFLPTNNLVEYCSR
jgi:hypothetical protein